jgi:hypothetical protein
MNHINGLIIPGGAAYFNYTNGYKDAGKNLIHIAQKVSTLTYVIEFSCQEHKLCPHIVDAAPSIDKMKRCRGSVRFQSKSIDGVDYVWSSFT